MKDKILDKIDKQNIEPTPKSYFDWIERAKWMTIGIFSVFSMFFIGFLIDDALEIYSYGPGLLRGAGIRFILPPLVWLILILIGIYFVIKEFRKTNTGYRYSLRLIVGIGLLLFLLAPILSFRLGLGPRMHGAIVDGVPGVGRFIYDETSWNDPENGKISGKIKNIDEKMLEIESSDRKIWKVDTQKAILIRRFELKVGDKIRAEGRLDQKGTFIAEKLFPWFGRGGMPGGGMMRGGMRGGMMRGTDRYGGEGGRYFSGSINNNELK